MAEISGPIARFEKMAIRYNPQKHPWFQQILLENLNLLRTKSVGQALFSRIAAATPQSRGDYGHSINIICSPSHVEYVQSRHKFKAYTNLNNEWVKEGIFASANEAHIARRGDTECRFRYYTKSGFGSYVKKIDGGAAENGTGSVCELYFANTQLLTGKGESTQPFIVLAHELIHCVHALEGINAGVHEEKWTTGINQYRNERMSENAFRDALGIDRRESY